MGLVGRDLSLGTQILMKASVCGGDFSMRLIEQSISHHKQKGDLSNEMQKMKIQHSKQTSIEFYVDPEWEKPRGGKRRNSLFSLCLQ